MLLVLYDLGTFPSVCVGKVGPLCNSCAESKESHGSPACESSIRARYFLFYFILFLRVTFN